ncbi:MAG: hypothetical protein NC321_09550 [Clostridium sp.]|nr:hypothetical protein [Clostridium sp.]
MAVTLKNIKVLCLFALLMLLLTGCGKTDEALEEYQADMETFFEHIMEFNDNMNAIDVEQADYLTQMLEYLDALDAEVAWMAQLEVPEQFSAVDNLADEASENMTQAVLFYHMAYENGEYDANVEEAAKEYYERANLRIQYIITILHGGVPEGEGITYTEDESIFGSGYMNQTDEDDSSAGESGNEGEGAESQGGESGAEPEAGNE